jgi:hypothetical protein
VSTDYSNFLRSLARQISAESALLSADAAEYECRADRILILASQCPAHDSPPHEIENEVTALLTANIARIKATNDIRRALLDSVRDLTI